MSSSNNLINGAIKVLTLPDLECYEDLKVFLLDLPNILGVQVPETITNVVVSNIQPTSDHRDSIWYRFSNGGTFMGVYMFSSGSWIQMMPAPGTIHWVHGISTSPPPGFILTDDWAGMSNLEKSFLKNLWFPVGTGPWTYFSIVAAGS